MSNIIRQVRAYEGEVVEIAWHCDDGSVFHQRLTVPSKPTREARTDERDTAGQVNGRDAHRP